MPDQRTILYDRHTAANARMVPFGGWEMPVQYTSVLTEHKAVRTGCGLFDVSHMGRLRFDGAGSLELLEKVFTNSVATMKDGQVRYGLVCEPGGGVLDDVLVYKWAVGYAMVVNASNRQKIVTWLDVHRAGLDVEMIDETGATALIAVQGPQAVATVAGLFADDVSKLKYYFATPSRYRDQPCVVSRTGYTGEDGFEVMVPNALAGTLWDELTSRGAVPCGLGARDTLRLEAGMPLYGHELNETIDPFAAGLGWAVKLDKGEFVGRDSLRMAHEQLGRSAHRVGLVLEGKRAAREGSGIELGDGRQIGTVTSGSYAPTLEKSIAMGYVDAGTGDRLLIDIRGSKVPATVVPLPFYKRAK